MRDVSEVHAIQGNKYGRTGKKNLGKTHKCYIYTKLGHIKSRIIETRVGGNERDRNEGKERERRVV